MKFTYDKEVDAAYIYLVYPLVDGTCKKTTPLNEDIILDFDAQDKLVGVEILNASKHLKKQSMEEAVAV